MVTGGKDGSNYLDTTEVYNKDEVWVTVSGRLPTGIIRPRAITLSNRVLMFGKNYHFLKVDLFIL